MQEMGGGAGVDNWYDGIAEIRGGRQVLHFRGSCIR
jgi:hypothetical protein